MNDFEKALREWAEEEVVSDADKFPNSYGAGMAEGERIAKREALEILTANPSAPSRKMAERAFDDLSYPKGSIFNEAKQTHRGNRKTQYKWSDNTVLIWDNGVYYFPGPCGWHPPEDDCGCEVNTKRL